MGRHRLAGCLPLRMVRMFLCPNKLRRSSDRLETAVLAVLAAAVAAVFAVAALLAAHEYRTDQAATAGLRLADAVLAPPGAIDTTYPGRATARATWRLSDGTERSGVLNSGTAPGLYGEPSGASVWVWLDRSGDPVSPPQGSADLAVTATLTGLAVSVCGAAAGVSCYQACRRRLDRHRLAGWSTAWADTGPRWTSRQ